MRAVVDRIEDGFAVLLFGNQEIKVDIPRELLPPSIKEGDILNVKFETLSLLLWLNLLIRTLSREPYYQRIYIVRILSWTKKVISISQRSLIIKTTRII